MIGALIAFSKSNVHVVYARDAAALASTVYRHSTPSCDGLERQVVYLLGAVNLSIHLPTHPHRQQESTTLVMVFDGFVKIIRIAELPSVCRFNRRSFTIAPPLSKETRARQ